MKSINVKLSNLFYILQLKKGAVFFSIYSNFFSPFIFFSSSLSLLFIYFVFSFLFLSFLVFLSFFSLWPQEAESYHHATCIRNLSVQTVCVL